MSTAIGVKDLFSDDLFEDEEDEKKQTTKTTTSKKTYLDEDWQLEKEDQQDFTGFPTEKNLKAKKEKRETITEFREAKKVPLFALMYKFRQEYYADTVDAAMSDHKGYARKFRRLINSQLMTLRGKKGVVLLWAGEEEGEENHRETKAEIMTFLEDDPLINKDMIETWDIIDLKVDKPEEGDDKAKAHGRKG